MRALPGGWPDPSVPLQTTPIVYLHVLDSVWPPQSVQGGETLPDGWTRVGQWSIESDLDAPLMPGQVNSGSNFTIATGTCTIPQPAIGMLAPWRTGKERTPQASHCELVASFDGYDGATVFVLGKFVLDPISGKVSEPFLTLTFVQDLVRLRKPHTFDACPPYNTLVPSPAVFFTPTFFLASEVERNGYIYDETTPLTEDATMGTSYFPRTTDELTAMQTIVAANLGAIFLTMDGTTIRVLWPDYLLGTSPVDATIQVLDSLEDLVWEQDPNSAVDRVEVSYLPPLVDDSSDATIWTPPKKTLIPRRSTVSYIIDPGHPVGPFPGDQGQTGYSTPTGGGTSGPIGCDYVSLSSSRAQITFTNTNDVDLYWVDPFGDPIPIQGGGEDHATAESNTRTIAWGVDANDAANTLTFDLGRNVQTASAAQAILERITTRISTPTYVLGDVRVVPDVRRELADLYQLQFQTVGFDERVMVTGIKLSGGPGGIEQTLTLAALGLILMDFDAAWDAALPGATIDDFDAAWDAAFPGATIDDFDANPLTT